MAERPQVLEQGGCLRAVLAKPLLLTLARRAAGEYLVAEIREGLQAPPPCNRESQHANAALTRLTRGVSIRPRHVVARARREDADVVIRRQALRERATMGFGASCDVGAVSLDDERELHRERRRTSWRSWAVSMASACTQADKHLVHAALSLEIVAAVLEQPSKDRHQDPSLDEDDERASRLLDATDSASRSRGARFPDRRAARGGGAHEAMRIRSPPAAGDRLRQTAPGRLEHAMRHGGGGVPGSVPGHERAARSSPPGPKRHLPRSSWPSRT